MRVIVERSGGFAGVRREATVDGAALPPADAALLRASVEAAGFFALPTELRAIPPRPDGLAWRIEVEDGGRRHAVRVDEAAARASLRALVALVEELAAAPGAGR